MLKRFLKIGGRVTAGSAVKVAMIGTALVGGVGVVSSSVFASLTATTSNTSSHAISTHTLKLTHTASAVSGLTGGFSTPITGMAPGDVVNRFIELTNGGTMAGQTMTLALSDTASSTLTSSSTNGLQIQVFECATQWTTISGQCSGGVGTSVMASTPATTLLSTPGTVSLASLAAGTTSHLRVQITLPAGSEVTTNGTLPAGTVQGVTSYVTWTFTETQRTATTTQS